MAKARYVVIIRLPNRRTRIVANVDSRAKAKRIAREDFADAEEVMIRKVAKRRGKKKKRK